MGYDAPFVACGETTSEVGSGATSNGEHSERSKKSRLGIFTLLRVDI